MTGKMITSAHCKRTRGRREFLSDAFCGFGSLAFAAMLQKEQARAATVNPLAPKAPPQNAKAKSVIFLFMAGGSEPPGDVRPEAAAQQVDRTGSAKEFGEVKRQFISGEPKLLGTKRTFRQHGKSGLWVSDLLPNIAEWCRRPGCDSLMPGRCFRALRRSIPVVYRPYRSRFSRHGSVDHLRSGIGKRIPAGLCGDA